MKLTIRPINATFVRLDCEPALLYELSERLSFKIANARFHPLVKSGRWNGVIKMVNIPKQTIQKGLVPEVVKYCKGAGYKVEIDPSIRDQFKNKSTFDWDALDLPDGIEPRDYQIRAVNTGLQLKRSMIVSATGSGKSLIIYAIVRSLVAKKKILIITKQTMLVDQMKGDFASYSENSESFDAEKMVHKIYSGKDKQTDKPITCSTWQSLKNQKRAFFEQFDALIFDEVHSCDAKVATSIVEKMTNAEFRIGFTGTLKDSKTHEMSLSGLFGPPVTITETQELIDKGILADMTIYPLIFKYSNEQLKDVGAISKLKYQDEINFITGNQQRLEKVANLCAKLKGNVLLLFNYIEKHGEPQEAAIRACVGENKIVGMIHGKVPIDERNRLKQVTEDNNNVVLCASYPLFQEGVNIKNIDHVILCSPTKSKIRLFQSIGRGLRKKQDDSKLCVWDLVDDLRGGKQTTNFAVKHFLARYEMYSSAKHKVRIREIDIQ